MIWHIVVIVIVIPIAALKRGFRGHSHHGIVLSRV